MKDELVVVDIGKEFSRFPAGRTPDDGKYCGETFRNRFLTTPLSAGKRVAIELDNAMSYGSSFLEEAFGGLIRRCGYTIEAIRSKIDFRTQDPFLRDEIWSYIDDASKEK